MNKARTQGRPEGGSTLIEMLVVTLIFAIVLGMTGSLFAAGTRVFSRETVTVGLQADLAAAKNAFLDDVSIAGYSPDGAVSSPAQYFPDVQFTDGDADRIEFVGDVDSDGATDRVCYRLANGRLERVVTAAASACDWNSAQTMAAAAHAFNLTFLDADRNALTTSSQVTGGQARYVQVSVGVGAPTKAGFIEKALFGEVAIRN